MGKCQRAWNIVERLIHNRYTKDAREPGARCQMARLPGAEPAIGADSTVLCY